MIPFFPLARYVPLDPGFRVFRWWKHSLGFAAFLVLFSLALVAVRGLDYGVDFRGGVQVELRPLASANSDLEALRSRVGDLVPGALLQEFGDEGDVLVNLPLSEGATEEAEGAAALAEISLLKESLGSDYEFRRTEFVGPRVGEELRRAGLLATALSLLAIAVYVWFRFEWQFAVAAFLTLLHDVIATVGFYALTGIEFNLTTLAAVLTVAGYSINDTVVIFDRVREILRRHRGHDVTYALTEAPNRTLSRTLLTMVTTLVAVMVLFIFAGPLVRGLAAGLLFGLLLGTWSSIAVAIPLVRLFGFSRAQMDEAEGL